MIRMALFVFTNFAVIFVFSIILSFINITSDNLYYLVLFSSIFGFLGSLVSLFLSKCIALYSVGGRIITHPSNYLEIKLFKIVHDQSKSLGIKLPQIAIYESTNVNAFATGSSSNSSLIALSTGLLQKLTDNEIKAVIGHEMNHIHNGDMVTMVLLQGILNTFIIFFSRLFSYFISLLFYNNEDKDEYNTNIDNSWLYFIFSFLLELLFGIFANIIVMWFSRRREFYADAGSAKLVGVDKMISALKSIQLTYNNFNDDLLSPSLLCFYINGKKDFLLDLFMSHPSLEKRIYALKNKLYF